jgi:hypothetical protein
MQAGDQRLLLACLVVPLAPTSSPYFDHVQRHGEDAGTRYLVETLGQHHSNKIIEEAVVEAWNDSFEEDARPRRSR